MVVSVGGERKEKQSQEMLLDLVLICYMKEKKNLSLISRPAFVLSAFNCLDQIKDLDISFTKLCRNHHF